MPTVDNLDIKISAEATAAGKELDKLIEKLDEVAGSLGSIMKSSGLKDATKGFENLGSQIGSISKNISKNIEDATAPMKKMAKSVGEITAKYKDLGKDFQFFGSSEAAQKQIEKYSNSLENAKLKKQELELSGKTEGKGYEDAIRSVQKYSNILDSLKEKTSTSITFKGDLSLMNEEELDKWFKNLPSIKAHAEESAKDIQESFEKITKPIKEIDMSLVNFSSRATQAFTAPQAEIKNATNNFDKLKEVSEAISEKFLEMKGRLENAFVSSGLKIYTSEYKDLQDEVEKTKEKIKSLNDQMARSKETTKNFEKTTSYRKLQYDIAEARKEFQRLRGEQDKLEISSGATKWNFSGLTTGFGKSFSSMNKNLENVNKKISSFVKKIKSIIAPIGSAKKSTDGLNLSNEGLAKSLTRLSRTFSMMIRSMAVRGVIDGVKVGFQNLVQYSNETNVSMSMLVNSINQLKNAFAAAVAPIFNTFAPALNFLIQKIIFAVNSINQLFSALLGKDTYIRATKLTDNYAASLGNANKKAEELYSTTLGIDELNIISPKTEQDSGAGNGVTAPEDMFETVPIESKFKDVADIIKGLLSKIFNPLKEAWERVGKFVVDSWKYALQEVWQLVKDIGRDFLTVWNQESTIKMFEDILYIVGDIGLIIGNLANGLDEAWNKNKTGLQILENIRDIFSVIISHIRNMADATLLWSANLDFSPLLEKIQAWTESLVPVFDNLSGIVEDFYTTALLPLGKWTLEEGLPKLVDVFIKFNDAVDWEALRTNLKDFWTHLEPFAERVGEGLILFVEDISVALTGFINSEEFKGFLDRISKWMDEVSAEDVASGLKNIAEALIALKAAVIGFSAVSSGIEAISKLGIAFQTFKKASEMLKGIQIIPFLTQLFSSMNPGMIGEIGIKLGDLLNHSFLDPREWDNWFGELYTSIYNGINNLIDSVIGPAILSVFDAIGQILSSTFNWDITKSLFDSAKENFKTGGVNIILGVIEGILSVVGLIVEPIGDFFVGLWNAFCDVFGIHSPAETMKPIGENILLGVIEGFINSIGEFLSAIGQWASETITSFSEKYIEIKDSVVSWFLELPGEIYTAISTFITETLPQWKSEIVSFIETNIPEIIDNIVGFFSDLPGRLVEIGKQAIEGLWSGVTGAAGWIGENITGFVTEFIDGFKGAFDIHSPSRRMEEIGQFAKEGLFTPFYNADENGVISGFANSIITLLQGYLGEGSNIFAGISTSLKTTWEETSIWWLAEIQRWLNDDVKAWFNAEDWKVTYSTIKTALESTWDEILSWWRNAIYRWYNDDVKIWFVKEKWIFPGIKDGLAESFTQAFESCNQLIDNFIKETKNKFDNMIKDLNAQMTTISNMSVSTANVSVMAMSLDYGDIPQYEAGGFPKTASLFWAGENGIPELMGTVGGKTAVAGGDEITGIRNAVYDSGNTQAQLLSTAIELLQIIAEKDMSVNIGDREVVESYERGRARMGINFSSRT